MKLELRPIGIEDARAIINVKHGVESYTENEFAMSVVDVISSNRSEEITKLHGVIIMRANGVECSLVRLYTDGTALVGSILYGAAWRTAKALGYKTITI